MWDGGGLHWVAELKPISKPSQSACTLDAAHGQVTTFESEWRSRLLQSRNYEIIIWPEVIRHGMLRSVRKVVFSDEKKLTLMVLMVSAVLTCRGYLAEDSQKNTVEEAQ